MLIGEIEMAREQGRVVRNGARPIDNNVLSPGIESMSVWIGKPVRDIHVGLLRSWLVAEHGSIGNAARRSPGGLNLTVMERPFLEVHRTPWIERKAVDRMMRVCGVKAMGHA